MNAIQSTQSTVELILKAPDGQCRVHRLGSEGRVLVGSSDHCGLRLEDASVSNYHCVISLEQGSVWVQGWSTAAETLVNGQTISGKTMIGAEDELCIGRYRVVPKFGAPSAELSCESTASQLAFEQVDFDRRSADYETNETGRPCETSQAVDPGAAAVTDVEASETLRTNNAPGSPGETGAPADFSVDRDSFAGDSFAGDSFAGDSFDRDSFAGDAFAGSAFPGDAFPGNAFAEETFDRETVELLRAEIEDLQSALAQRDAIDDGFPAGPEPEGSPSASGPNHDDDALLARVQQLLEEAESSDERIAVLEEMLQTAEEANQAGQEERHQLQQWIGEIEHRIGQREAEWKAEIEAYQSQLEEARQQRNQAQQQLKQAAQRGGVPQGYEETLQRLQQRNKELQEELAESNKERAVLKERLEQGDTRTEQALREERAEIAQERAAVSRMRHELSSKLASLEEMPTPKNQPDREFTGRLQTLREHLREIHAQERDEREQRESTLTGRLSRLWNRLES